MDFLNLVQVPLHQPFVFLIHQVANVLSFFYLSKRPKVANVLFLGNYWTCKKAVIESFSDEEIQSTSWESIFGNIKFKFFDFGECCIARRVCRDYGAKVDAIAYIVNDDMDTEQFWGPRNELNDLLSDEAFANVPLLIFDVNAASSPPLPIVRLDFFLGLLEVITGTRTVEPADENARPLEVFVAKAEEFFFYFIFILSFCFYLFFR